MTPTKNIRGRATLATATLLISALALLTGCAGAPSNTTTSTATSAEPAPSQTATPTPTESLDLRGFDADKAEEYIAFLMKRDMGMRDYMAMDFAFRTCTGLEARRELGDLSDELADEFRGQRYMIGNLMAVTTSQFCPENNAYLKEQGNALAGYTIENIP